MGARTPHELMRCVEVTFIRDCAELAARASLVREESRWGLYHSRADLPAARRRRLVLPPQRAAAADGATEFLRRPVASYVVPVEDVEIPAGAPQDVAVLGVVEPRQHAGPAATGVVAHEADAELHSPRVLELLELAETGPTSPRSSPILADPDPQVRRAAVAT